MANRRGKSRSSDQFYWAQKSLWMVTVAIKLKDTYSLEGKLWPTGSILKSRDITLPTKIRIVKAMVFPVVLYGCESGTIKKTEHQRIDAFELWGWRRLLRVPWTARRSSQSILKEISPGCSFEGLMLPCPSPGDLPDLGIKPMSLMSPALAGGFFTTSSSWEAHLSP